MHAGLDLPAIYLSEMDFVCRRSYLDCFEQARFDSLAGHLSNIGFLFVYMRKRQLLECTSQFTLSLTIFGC